MTGIADDATELRSVPLAGLEHVEYCERQAALIQIEGIWSENIHTVRGDLVHKGVDLPGVRSRKGINGIRALPVFSSELGLHGVCDLVEFSGNHAVPVEYKAGAYRAGGPADVQLAGQAACLTGAGFAVPVGYVYSAADRHRHAVPITDDLLDRMRRAADRLRALLEHDQLPRARNDARCRRCSLRDDCLPTLTHRADPPVDLFTPRPLGGWHD
ncbi:CRISPR-associated protein Cas4 [Rhodococcus xishaensis]|uniref:CRISPR-associated exonuclease Cas4 n=1 Tax=Rhodococcus xishaensis TaxID=2487364 RepID=A0A438AU60_9NOCA|nr:CRISPR-associated protein Cas4 [Rhodococcus xishaensis]RVW02205.1 CRISPR-associated protein Cas4 [Rhodococcus xishaensis]